MTPSATTRRWATAAGSLLAALIGLAACDGGEPVEDFEPTRLIAFGDESTLITANGRKFSINYVDSEGTLDCTRYPVWVQSVATNYGMVFPQCNPGDRTPAAQMRAIQGATVADLRGQLIDFLANDAPGNRDLVTVMVGANDVLELYRRYPELSEEQITAELETRGRRLAAAINRVVEDGPRVIAMTVPDISYSPYARAERAAHTDIDRAQLLRRLVSAFNRGLRLDILNDGRKIGLVFADAAVEDMVVDFPDYGLRNPLEAACANAAVPPVTTALPLLECTNASEDLVADASPTTWLWADTLRLGPTGQARLGSLAVSRANNNPF
jgi:lysophospholipase L1-like esterase